MRGLPAILNPEYRKNVESRFWPKVNKTEGCWLWTGCTMKKCGYGTMGVAYSSQLAHRISYVLATNQLPGGLFVCHKCDVRNCVRPDHLFLGTRDDNAKDCKNKGRATRGERSTQAKLTETQVLKILHLLKEKKLFQREIAKQFKVAPKTINEINVGRNWYWLTGIPQPERKSA